MAKKSDEKNSKNTTKIEEKKIKITTKKQEKKVTKKELRNNKEISPKKVKDDKEATKKEENNKEAITEVEPKESREIAKIEDIKKTLKAKNTLPKAEMEKINKSLFTNIIIAICIIIYFIFLNFGQMNIKSDVYITDLKVFGMCTLLLAIVLIETAYKKDSGEIALYGVEMIVLSITTVALIYVNLILSIRYVYIVSVVSFIFAIYYLIKSIIIYSKRKKKYFVNNMKEIMNKDE